MSVLDDPAEELTGFKDPELDVCRKPAERRGGRTWVDLISPMFNALGRRFAAGFWFSKLVSGSIPLSKLLSRP